MSAALKRLSLVHLMSQTSLPGLSVYIIGKGKGKAIPLQAWTGA
jgi:hypothetical protein